MPNIAASESEGDSELEAGFSGAGISDFEFGISDLEGTSGEPGV
jgi:hypothetical protein